MLSEAQGVLMARKPPTKPFSEDRAKVAQQIFEGMRKGLSAYKACVAAGVNQSVFNLWLRDDVDMATEYARAREDLIERIANEIIEISDQDVEVSPEGKKDWAAIQKHKLQVDTRRWLLSKLAPKRYGEKLEISGDQDSPLKIEKIERVIVDQSAQSKKD